MSTSRDVDELVAALEALPMHRYDDLAADSADGPPEASGLYAWWQLPGALPGVSAPMHRHGGLELLYVGTAPSSARSRLTLKQRLAKHHRAAVGSSTFRLVLSAFLWQSQDWHPLWTDRVVLNDKDLEQLAAWQRCQLSVQWVDTREPWLREAALIRRMCPPLNRAHNRSHPFYPVVGAARAALRRAAFEAK
jgi:hypothetical protein